MTQHRPDSPLSIRNGHLFVEDCDTVALAEEFGTPLFVVSESHLVENLKRFQSEYERCWPEGPVRIMCAIKANPITAIRRVLTREGAGCDTFGGGELELALRGKVPTDDIAVNGSIKSPEINGAGVWRSGRSHQAERNNGRCLRAGSDPRTPSLT